MTDLEMTMFCAKAAVGTAYIHDSSVWLHCSKVLTFTEPRREVNRYSVQYNPLHNDAQKWALAERFPECLVEALGHWRAMKAIHNDCDLGRTLCECVAKMQQEKEKKI